MYKANTGRGWPFIWWNFLVSGVTATGVGHLRSFPYRTLAALNYPRLFSSLILVDPIIGFSGVFITDRAEHVSKLVSGTLVRRDTWPSRCVSIPSRLRSVDSSQRRSFTPLQAIALFRIVAPRGARALCKIWINR